VRIGSGAVILLLGVVWVLQGVGVLGGSVLGGSVMTGSRFWAWIGAACIVAAAVLLLGSLLPRKRR